jgi:hypothetical protein
MVKGQKIKRVPIIEPGKAGQHGNFEDPLLPFEFRELAFGYGQGVADIQHREAALLTDVAEMNVVVHTVPFLAVNALEYTLMFQGGKAKSAAVGWHRRGIDRTAKLC